MFGALISGVLRACIRIKIIFHSWQRYVRYDVAVVAHV